VRTLGIDLAWNLGTEDRPANETGVVALEPDGTILDGGWTVGVEATLAWIERLTDPDGTLAFVDASLLVPNPAGMRECEKWVGRCYGRWKVGANATNAASPGRAGVVLRESLERQGWRYDDGLDGPPVDGLVFSECYPYTTLVGVAALGYDAERPRYKRQPKGMRALEYRPARAAVCDDLIRRLERLPRAGVPLDLRSHPATSELLDKPSPLASRAYKHREDLIDAVLCAWTAQLWWRAGEDQCQVLADRSDSRPTPSIIAACRPEQRAARPRIDAVSNPGPAARGTAPSRPDRCSGR
jgi:predicted RNase H-like nuclease